MPDISIIADGDPNKEVYIKMHRASVQLKPSIFKKIEVLTDLNINLANGDRVALVGGNGAGKTTFLRLASGIYSPYLGSVEISGRTNALFSMSLGTRQQSSGRENMIIRFLLEGRSYKNMKEALPRSIEFADIGDKIDAPMETYSRGMGLRVLFSASTVFQPEILLIDEWIGAGDLEFRNKVEGRMDELAESSSILMLASHRKDLTTRVCNKGIYLKKGRIAFFGDVEECWETYERDVRADMYSQ